MKVKGFTFSVIAATALLQVVFLSSSVSASLPIGGARQTDMLEQETLLSNLGYWIMKVDGLADASTRHAIIAFQKVELRERTGVLNPGDLEVLRSAVRPRTRFATGKPHIEVDITRQVLFLTDDQDIVVRVLPVSTGTDKRYGNRGRRQLAHTPRGDFRIERKINGIRHAPLGDLYYPNYFFGGVAIHGSLSVPPTPASHGCVRIPHFADKAFSNSVWVGMAVFVYD